MPAAVDDNHSSWLKLLKYASQIDSLFTSIIFIVCHKFKMHVPMYSMFIPTYYPNYKYIRPSVHLLIFYGTNTNYIYFSLHT